MALSELPPRGSGSGGIFGRSTLVEFTDGIRSEVYRDEELDQVQDHGQDPDHRRIGIQELDQVLDYDLDHHQPYYPIFSQPLSKLLKSSEVNSHLMW